MLEDSNSDVAEYLNKNQIYIGVNIMGFILSMTTGWVDTVGFKLFLNENSAFLTGRGSILGYSVFMSDYKAVISIALVVIAFIAGSFIATKINKTTGLTGSLFFTGILIIIASFPISLQNSSLYSLLIPIAMGCQNAATTLTAINRTTHLTGPATDIGISIANKDWKLVRFWSWRWIGFPLGSIIGFSLINLANNNVIHISTTLLLPGLIIILAGFIQRLFLNIPQTN